MLFYIVTFCRVTIGLVFVWSFGSKVRDVSEFEKTVAHFQILPLYLVRPLTFAFLGGELVVAVSMLANGPILQTGFLLAAFLLTIFCVALGLVLFRKIQTSCNCFGVSKTPISNYDLLRNMGFIACALSGYVILQTGNNLPFSGWLENILVSVIAVVFVVMWVQFREFVRLFQV